MPNDQLPKITQNWVDRQLGLVCPSCGNNRWFVISTWRYKTEIHRTRECRACQFQINTYEKSDLQK